MALKLPNYQGVGVTDPPLRDWQILQPGDEMSLGRYLAPLDSWGLAGKTDASLRRSCIELAEAMVAEIGRGLGLDDALERLVMQVMSMANVLGVPLKGHTGELRDLLEEALFCGALRRGFLQTISFSRRPGGSGQAVRFTAGRSALVVRAGGDILRVSWSEVDRLITACRCCEADAAPGAESTAGDRCCRLVARRHDPFGPLRLEIGIVRMTEEWGAARPSMSPLLRIAPAPGAWGATWPITASRRDGAWRPAEHRTGGIHD